MGHNFFLALILEVFHYLPLADFLFLFKMRREPKLSLLHTHRQKWQFANYKI